MNADFRLSLYIEIGQVYNMSLIRKQTGKRSNLTLLFHIKHITVQVLKNVTMQMKPMQTYFIPFCFHISE